MVRLFLEPLGVPSTLKLRAAVTGCRRNTGEQVVLTMAPPTRGKAGRLRRIIRGVKGIAPSHQILFISSLSNNLLPSLVAPLSVGETRRVCNCKEDIGIQDIEFIG